MQANGNTLIGWLKDAYAMEVQLVPILRERASRTGLNAHVRARIDAHTEETVRHAARMREALQILGSRPPVVQTAAAPWSDVAHTISSGILSDERVKRAITDFVVEQLEVAAYTALIAEAENAGEAAVARLCRLNRAEDEEMAEWLDAQIPIAIEQRLRYTRADRSA